MTTQHYLSDLHLSINPPDIPGVEGRAFVDYDFDLSIYCASDVRPNYVTARRSGAALTGGTVDDNGTLTVAADNHGFPPGRLWARLSVHIPDPSHPDGHRTRAASWDLGVLLTDRTGNESAGATSGQQEALPYAVRSANVRRITVLTREEYESTEHDPTVIYLILSDDNAQ